MQTPKVSVVIASHNPGAVMEDCLAALHTHAGGDSVEVIVSDSSTDGTPDLVRERFPEVRLLKFPAERTLPELRGAGIAEARGERIALLDPYCIARDNWLVEARQTTASATGGTVEFEDRQPFGRWATYLAEYAAFLPPLAAGPATELPGNNLVYRREALGNIAALKDSGFWKAAHNERLKNDGHQLWNTPSLCVTLRKPIPVGEFFRSRYHHGRSFAGRRAASLLRALTAPLLPVLFCYRRTRGFWPKRRYRSRYLAALPLLWLFDCSWAWGELCGYLRGPGRSSQRLFY